MILALLALLGVPIWLLVGGLGIALYNRRLQKRHPGAFPCKLRVRSGTVSGFGADWQRSPTYAHWVHDVLLVTSGVALVRTRALAVQSVTSPAPGQVPAELRKLGPDPVMLTLILDENAVVEVTAPTDAGELLVGPFLLADVSRSKAPRTWRPTPG
ncbi:MAG: hypothetical protein QOJ32_156 [Frankiaceae bacterium]|nr:hypothetical protein [Frankiaceae bacterium]MDQ1673920.1 hypothetical protein [Frankiaceae bacterium]